VLDPPGLRWDRLLVPGDNDDVPPRPRGAVRPPPSQTPGDAPDTVDVPRMSPPPPSLGAMVEGAGRSPKKLTGPRASSLWIWGVVALATAALSAYLLR
jgi:hypothetical protein